VEIPPANQSQVDRPRQRVVAFRTMNVRRWDRIVAAWAAGDDPEMDDAWVDQVVDLGSQWGAVRVRHQHRVCRVTAAMAAGRREAGSESMLPHVNEVVMVERNRAKLFKYLAATSGAGILGQYQVGTLRERELW
jgi:hypothetical protein